ncbi:MAG: hypothetical protein VCC36_05875 [Gammaproteobacteria bacterium]
MTLPTRASRTSSAESERTFTVRPRVSLLLAWWWRALHVVGAAGIIGLPVSWLIRCPLLAALVVHWWRQLPETPPVLNCLPNGTWAAPGLGRTAVRLTSESMVATWWVRLVLRDGRGRLPVLLLRDQL